MKSPLFAKNLNLLKQRRLVRGLTAEPAPLPSATKLILQGAFVGALCIGVSLGAWLLATLRHAQVREELAGLQAIPGTLNSLEKQVPVEKSKLTAVQAASEALSSGLVAAPSGSALLTQLADITPSGVQLIDVSVQDASKTLLIKGLATDPLAFRKVNLLALLLGRSSLFDPASVAIIKVVRDDKKISESAQSASLSPLNWELSLKLGKLRPPVLLELLKGLDADGMAQRLILLQRAGVI